MMNGTSWTNPRDKSGKSDTHFHGHILVHTSNLEADVELRVGGMTVVVVGRYIMKDGCDSETDVCLIHIVSVCVCVRVRRFL